MKNSFLVGLLAHINVRRFFTQFLSLFVSTRKTSVRHWGRVPSICGRERQIEIRWDILWMIFIHGDVTYSYTTNYIQLTRHIVYHQYAVSPCDKIHIYLHSYTYIQYLEYIRQIKITNPKTKYSFVYLCFIGYPYDPAILISSYMRTIDRHIDSINGLCC